MNAASADERPRMFDRTMYLDDLKNRIKHDQYAVDPQAVAAAILAMLLRGRQKACS